MKHGAELEEVDKMLDQLMEEHGKDNEVIRNALAFEVQQMETDDALPTVEVDYKTASLWMTEGEKRRMTSSLSSHLTSDLVLSLGFITFSLLLLTDFDLMSF